MPILIATQTETPPPPPPADTEFLELTWTAPNGEVLTITGESLHALAGADGFGAAPRALTLRGLGQGGADARWSHAEERLLTLPLDISGETADEYLALKRLVTRLFLATTPRAGRPKPGTMRVTHGDGSWRELQAIYQDGLSWADEGTLGAFRIRPVLVLVAPDPWWYGDLTIGEEFAAATGRNYLSPYETVSPDQTLGSQQVLIESDVEVSPVWTVTGPASSVNIALVGGPELNFGSIASGEVITIDTERMTVTNALGTNRIGGLVWPTSELFLLDPGTNALELSIAGGTAGVSKIGLSYRPRWETA